MYVQTINVKKKHDGHIFVMAIVCVFIDEEKVNSGQ